MNFKKQNMKKINTGIFIAISLSLLSLFIGITVLALLYTNNVFRDNCTPTNSTYKDNHTKEITDTDINIGYQDRHVQSDSNSKTNDMLRLVPRLQWLANPPTHQPDLLKTPVPLVIIQHTATESCISLAQCIYQVRQIQQFHIESNQWWDISFNFLVGGNGAVYEGRGWKYEGAHTFGYNYKSIGVAFIGTFNSEVPPKNQIDAFKKLVTKGVELGYLEKDYKILGARQLHGTESPGAAFLKEIETWPHWSKEP